MSKQIKIKGIPYMGGTLSYKADAENSADVVAVLNSLIGVLSSRPTVNGSKSGLVPTVGHSKKSVQVTPVDEQTYRVNISATEEEAIKQNKERSAKLSPESKSSFLTDAEESAIKSNRANRLADRIARTEARIKAALAGSPESTEKSLLLTEAASSLIDEVGLLYLSKEQFEGLPVSDQSFIIKDIFGCSTGGAYSVDFWSYNNIAGLIRNPRALPADVPLVDESDRKFGWYFLHFDVLRATGQLYSHNFRAIRSILKGEEVGSETRPTGLDSEVVKEIVSLLEPIQKWRAFIFNAHTIEVKEIGPVEEEYETYTIVTTDPKINFSPIGDEKTLFEAVKVVSVNSYYNGLMPKFYNSLDEVTKPEQLGYVLIESMINNMGQDFIQEHIHFFPIVKTVKDLKSMVGNFAAYLTPMAKNCGVLSGFFQAVAYTLDYASDRAITNHKARVTRVNRKLKELGLHDGCDSSGVTDKELAAKKDVKAMYNADLVTPLIHASPSQTTLDVGSLPTVGSWNRDTQRIEKVNVDETGMVCVTVYNTPVGDPVKPRRGRPSKQK